MLFCFSTSAGAATLFIKLLSNSCVMVLSDRDIKARLKKGDFKVEPLDLSLQMGASSVDLRLGTRFRTFKLSNHSIIDPATFSDTKISEWKVDGA